MQFEYPEDQEFFAHLLTDGSIEFLEKEYKDLFDFRHPAIKRWEFDKTRKKVLQELIEKYKGECQLHLHPQCDISSGIEPDHIIPLSSNVLNKELRSQKRTSNAKVTSQSFGSNHMRNLTLACKRCNAVKKHHILQKEILTKLIPPLASQ